MVYTCVRGWAAMAYLRRVGPLHDFLSQLALRRRGLNEQICPKEAACLNSQTSIVERAAKPILRGHQWLCDLNWSNVSEYLCFSCEYSSILSRWGLFIFLLIWYIYIHRVQRFLTDQTCQLNTLLHSTSERSSRSRKKITWPCFDNYCMSQWHSSSLLIWLQKKRTNKTIFRRAVISNVQVTSLKAAQW